jgi:hypothetical protein
LGATCEYEGQNSTDNVVPQGGTIDKKRRHMHFMVGSIEWNHEQEPAMTKDTELTISVPEAGKRYYGISKNASYDAAKRGEIPTVQVGRLFRVPVRAMEAMLDKAVDRSAAA